MGILGPLLPHSQQASGGLAQPWQCHCRWRPGSELAVGSGGSASLCAKRRKRNVMFSSTGPQAEGRAALSGSRALRLGGLATPGGEALLCPLSFPFPGDLGQGERQGGRSGFPLAVSPPRTYLVSATGNRRIREGDGRGKEAGNPPAGCQVCASGPWCARDTCDRCPPPFWASDCLSVPLGLPHVPPTPISALRGMGELTFAGAPALGLLVGFGHWEALGA